MENEEHVQKEVHRPTMKALNSRRNLVLAAVESIRRSHAEEHHRQESAPVGIVVGVGAVRRPSFRARGKPCDSEGAHGSLSP